MLRPQRNCTFINSASGWSSQVWFKWRHVVKYKRYILYSHPELTVLYIARSWTAHARAASPTFPYQASIMCKSWPFLPCHVILGKTPMSVNLLAFDLFGVRWPQSFSVKQSGKKVTAMLLSVLCAIYKACAGAFFVFLIWDTASKAGCMSYPRTN